MTDLLKSAFSYISSAAAGTQRAADPGPGDDSSFVGQVVDIAKNRLRIRKAIAEGGFGIVYMAQDVHTGKDFTIKRMFAHESDRVESVVNEINFLKKLTGHVNIVEFIAAASDQDKEFLILTEYCGGGALVDHLQRQKLASFSEVLQVFYQICQAVRHMHSQRPAIIHRDLKIENVLLSDKYFIKLIDFGSATTNSYYPDSSWTGAKRSYVEDEMTRNTTPMYRPPEILDLYQNFPINESLDIWALGCVLYALCYNEHPYSDSSKLRIVNANYPTAPLNNDTVFNNFHDLIRGCFEIDPRKRPKIKDILERLTEFSEAFGFSLAKPLRFFTTHSPRSSPTITRSPPVARSASPSHPQTQQPQQPSSSGAGFGFGGQFLNQMKDQAGSFVKNIKDASTKVVDAVSSNVGKTDLDISMITSRILVMSQPSDGIETIMKNNIDEVRAWLDAKFYGTYAVFNLSSNCKYRHAKFDNRVSESGWIPDRVPPLAKLFMQCHQLYSWLSKGRDNVAVIHCLDGRTQSPIAVCAFLCFTGTFNDSTMAAQLFASRRGPSQLLPSMLRYSQYISRLRNGYKPQEKHLTLNFVALKPVPIVNRQRTGCKPYVEVHCGDQLVYTSQKDYASLRQYTVEDKTLNIPINVTVVGDVCISILHARSTLTDRMQGKQLSSIKICQLQFHTGFIESSAIGSPWIFDKNEVDLIERTPGTFRPDFGMAIELQKPNAQFSQKSYANSNSSPWLDYHFSERISPALVFGSPDEMASLIRGIKSGRGRSYQDEAGDLEKTEGLLDNDSDEYSPPVERKQPPNRPPAPSHLPPRPNAGGKTYGNSQFYTETEGTPELPSRPKAGPEFEADFSIFSPTIAASDTTDSSDAKNEAPLVDIWPGSSDLFVEAKPVDSSRSSNISGNEQNPIFDLAAPVEHHSSHSSTHSTEKKAAKPAAHENPFLVDFDSEQLVPTAVQQDLFGIGSTTEPAQAVSQQPAHGGDDLFGLFTATSNVNVTQPTQNPLTAEAEISDGPVLMPSAVSSGNDDSSLSTSKDPFADIFGSGGSNNGFGSSGKKKPMGQMAQAKPQHQQPSPVIMNTGVYGRSNYSPKPTQQSQNQNRSSPVTVAPPKPQPEEPKSKNSDPFAEIFDRVGISDMSSNRKPTTMGAMREEILVKDNDPEVVKVRLWSEGKTNNIRALLSTLDHVLWEEAKSRWEPILIHKIVQVSDVKRAYKRAVVVIHPDKQVGQPHERLARLIFVELNEAWSEFEKEAMASP